MTAEDTEVEETNDLEPSEAADGIVKSNMKWAAGAGLIPLPYVDGIAIVGVQLRMISQLSKVYDVKFSENAGKAAIISLVGTTFPAGIVGGAASMVKGVPGVGPLIGLTVVPAFAAALTYAVGRAFTKHFEAGGTLLSFDADEMRDYFQEEFDSAKSGGKAESKKSSSKAAAA